MEAWDERVVQPLSKLTGETTDVVHLFLCMVACLPVALFHRLFFFRVSPTIQHLYFFITGAGLFTAWLGWDSLHLAIPSLLGYVLVCVMPAGTLRSSIFLIAPLAHLVWGLSTYASDEYSVGWMTPACVNVQALFAFCMDVTDSRLPPEKKNADQKMLSIAKIPSLIAYLGFKFNPLTAVGGPMINFNEYERFVHGAHLKDFDAKKYSLTLRSVMSCLRCLLQAVLGVALTFVGVLIVPKSMFLADTFEERDLVTRIALLTIHGMLDLCKYVGVWKLVESAACLCTLGYSGTDASGPQFHLCRQVHFGQLVLPTNCAMYSVKFNCATHRFVKRYIFKRLAFLGNWYASLLLSTIYISIWHGVHFGYFWTFLICEFLTLFVETRYITVLKNLTGVQSLASLPLVPRVIAHALCSTYTHMAIAYGYIGMSFLGWGKVVLVATRVGFYFHVSWAVLLLVHVFLPASWKSTPAKPVASAKKTD
ncbi:lysophospholipid acyltransferase 5-like isoform X2 [Sycon ciliatum]|uniref:lysophospholipid acyltransferase 5-like isoform X2 n=1 Tax=Sycon ciliatum TaxID=27933 RepID=UPI0031F6F1B1